MRKYSLASVILTAMILALVVYSPLAKSGAIKGIDLCAGVILPALLPVLILTNIIIKSKCSMLFEKVLGFFVRGVFKLPAETSGAIFFGLIGGYPTGAVLTLDLYERGIIDSKIAGRIMRFNFSGGLAFIVTAVGSMCFGNSKTGVILFIINLLSSIIIGIISGIGNKYELRRSTQTKGLCLSDALVESVDSSVESVLTMCAYIILFSALCNIVPYADYGKPLLEITNGLCTGNFYSVALTSAFLSFGGLCIHFQLFGILKKMGINYFNFLFYRLLAALISYFIGTLYCKLFGVGQSVFCSFSSPVSYDFTQVNGTVTAVMLLGCVVLIYDIKNRTITIKNKSNSQIK